MALGERGRNPLVPRSTAENMCALRAAGTHERDASVRCPDDMAAGFLGGLNITTLAKYRLTRRLLLSGVNRRVPGLYTYELMRVKFIDEILLRSLSTGLDDVVLLGAGLDSRAYRLTKQLHGVRIIEVDHPQSQRSKRTHLRRLLGREPTHVTFIEIDFLSDDLNAAFAAVDHDRSSRTLFIWSGVSPYLPEHVVTNLLSWVGSHTDPRTSIVFDACWRGAVDGSRDYRGAAEWRKAVAKMGEPVCWGIPEGHVDGTLAPLGLRLERLLTAEDGRIAYLRRSDSTTHDRPMDCFVLIQARPISEYTSRHIQPDTLASRRARHL